MTDGEKLALLATMKEVDETNQMLMLACSCAATRVRHWVPMGWDERNDPIYWVATCTTCHNIVGGQAWFNHEHGGEDPLDD